MRSGVRRCSVSEPPKSQAEAADQHQLEPLQCPRCNSTDTKFCYYNNYNLSQPRHFCRTCRRYWTVGGTLRNVPVGGATRRSATPPSSSPSSTLYGKRRRSSRPAARSSADAELVSAPAETQPAEQKAVFETMIMTEQEEAAAVDPDVAGTFEQVLAEPLPPGFLALGGDPFLQGHAACFGIDLGLGLEGFEDVGFGLGRAAPWNLPGAGDDAADGGFGVGMAGGVEEVWNISGGRGGVVGGDARGCFAWPDLAISTPSGKRM